MKNHYIKRDISNFGEIILVDNSINILNINQKDSKQNHKNREPNSKQQNLNIKIQTTTSEYQYQTSLVNYQNQNYMII